MEDPEQEKEKGADEFVIATEAPAGPVILYRLLSPTAKVSDAGGLG